MTLLYFRNQKLQDNIKENQDKFNENIKGLQQNSTKTLHVQLT